MLRTPDLLRSGMAVSSPSGPPMACGGGSCSTRNGGAMGWGACLVGSPPPPHPPPSPASPTAGGLRSLAGPSPPLARWPRPPSGCRPPRHARGLADVGGLGPVALVDYSASTDTDSPGISAIPALQLAWRRLRLRLPRRCLPSSPWGRAGGSTTGASHILHATSAPVVSLHSEPPIGKYRHPPRIED